MKTKKKISFYIFAKYLILISLAVFIEHTYKLYKSRFFHNLFKNKNQSISINQSNTYSIDLNKKINIENLKLSETACKFLLHDLEGVKTIESKVFLGSGNVLSIGNEFVFKIEDLYNRGIFNKAGFKIEDYLSGDFIAYLKDKFKKFTEKHDNKIVIKLTTSEFQVWEKNNALKKSLSIEEGLVLFKSYIDEDVTKLKKIIKVPLFQWEFDAIILALYNLGLKALKESGFFQALNNNDITKAGCILASIRNLRLDAFFPNVWKKGEIEHEDFIEFIHNYDAFNIYLQNEKINFKKLMDIKIPFEKLRKLNAIHCSNIKIPMIDFIPIDNITSLNKLANDEDKKEIFTSLSNNFIYKDELLHIIRLKELENHLIINLWKSKFSILSFIIKSFSILIDRVLSINSSNQNIWTKNKISFKIFLEEIENYRKFTKYIYIWCVRDFVQANMFLKKHIFNYHAKPSEIFDLKDVDQILFLDKFWYTLRHGKHISCLKREDEKQNLVFYKIENFFQKYFKNLSDEFNTSKTVS